MTLRDTKILTNLIEKNLTLGLSFDNILEEFENKEKIQIQSLQWVLIFYTSFLSYLITIM